MDIDIHKLCGWSLNFWTMELS